MATKIVFATLAGGAWINLCEFLRNELLFKQRWVAHYAQLGLEFPSAPMNNALWGAWGFLLAGCLAVMVRRMTVVEATVVGWVLAFVMMWLVMGNLAVLPFGLLPVAVPWSLAEVAVATIIVRNLTVGRDS